MHHPPITVGGAAISLSHLSRFRRRVTLELPGAKTKAVDVEFRFSCHCYSRGLRDGEVPALGQAVPDGSRHTPRPRVFDGEPYELSKDLIGMLDQLILRNGIVSKSRHDNFHRVDKVQAERNGSMKTVSYFIFMHARRLEPPGRPKSVLVVVESAYPQQDDIPDPVGHGVRTFGQMLGETWVSRPQKR